MKARVSFKINSCRWIISATWRVICDNRLVKNRHCSTLGGGGRCMYHNTHKGVSLLLLSLLFFSALLPRLVPLFHCPFLVPFITFGGSRGSCSARRRTPHSDDTAHALQRMKRVVHMSQHVCEFVHSSVIRNV